MVGDFWRVVGIWFPLAIGVITTAWFRWGGLKDLRILFRRLDEAHKLGKEAGTAEAVAKSNAIESVEGQG